MNTTKPAPAVAHTPVPWELIGKIQGYGQRWEIRLAKPAYFADGHPSVVVSGDCAEANATFIARAVNCHQELVEALERCARFLTSMGFTDQGSLGCRNAAINALAKAKGGAV